MHLFWTLVGSEIFRTLTWRCLMRCYHRTRSSDWFAWIISFWNWWNWRENIQRLGSIIDNLDWRLCWLQVGRFRSWLRSFFWRLLCRRFCKRLRRRWFVSRQLRSWISNLFKNRKVCFHVRVRRSWVLRRLRFLCCRIWSRWALTWFKMCEINQNNN